MCPEELNLRQDDEHREQYEECKEDEKTEQIVPNFVDMKKLKDFELKSNCKKFYSNTEGF